VVDWLAQHPNADQFDVTVGIVVFGHPLLLQDADSER
jgi:hypothetical protein